jgi:hypothetical protein
VKAATVLEKAIEPAAGDKGPEENWYTEYRFF